MISAILLVSRWHNDNIAIYIDDARIYIHIELLH